MLFALIFRKPKEDDEDETENQLKKDEVEAATAMCGTPENSGQYKYKIPEAIISSEMLFLSYIEFNARLISASKLVL